MKFGKIPMEDLEMMVYEKDTNASAVILGDEGYSNFIFTEDKGWQLQTKIHRRIKILKQTGMDWADGEVLLYSSGSNKEELIALKGFTNNLSSGKIEKAKISNDAVFTEEIDDFYTSRKFTFPDVKPGSVLEYTYTVVSDFYWQPDPWQFQYGIPVVESQYTIEIPEEFKFNEQSKGYETFTRSQDYQKRTFSYNYSSQIDANAIGGRTSGGTYEFERIVSVQNYQAKEIPAFISEPDMNSIQNYLTSVEFELMSYVPQSGLKKDFSNTWESINKTLIESEKFGMQLKGTGFLSDLAESIKAAESSELKMAMSAYESIKSKMKWNGYSRLYAKKNIRSAYNDGVGNCAEINLLLVALLRRLNLDAKPVILSIRSRGIIMPGQVMLSKFNYVIACVKMNNEMILLDATDRNCPFNMLPERCLNGQGRIISENYTDWVDLGSNQVHASVCYVQAELSADGSLKALVEESHKAYSAYEKRDCISKEPSVNDYISKFEQAKKGIEISGFEVVDKDSINKPLGFKYCADFSQQITGAGDLIYFNPVILGRKDSNPYKLDVRKYPVDYIYPRDSKYIINYTIPENYNVTEIPKSISYSLPEKTLIFTYTINHDRNKIRLIYGLKINKTVFSYNEYPALKQFYENLVAKQAEQIVLKKIN
ncbi:MAG: DUF3857 domain-containing protein [Bacteroidales bacterium]|nr:DUF3857 domain-containing protein [Bacteroidales bacterium]